MIKRKKLTCKDCIYCGMGEKTEDNFAPCLVNPPELRYNEEAKNWMSGRPWTNIDAAACRFGKK